MLASKRRNGGSRVTSEALELLAQVAEAAGRPQFAENLRMGAELVNVPEEQILEIYKALRPGWGSRQMLLDLSADIEKRFQAKRCAALLREAAGSSVGHSNPDFAGIAVPADHDRVHRQQSDSSSSSLPIGRKVCVNTKQPILFPCLIPSSTAER